MDDYDYSPDLYTLEDENGNTETFELLDTLDEDGVTYYALLPVYDDAEKSVQSNSEFIVLRAETNAVGEDELVTVDDEDEYERIGGIFLERLENFYDGDDEGDEFDGDDYYGEEES